MYRICKKCVMDNISDNDITFDEKVFVIFVMNMNINLKNVFYLWKKVNIN